MMDTATSPASLHADVAAYIAHRKARKGSKTTKFRTFVAASFNSPAGMSDAEFSTAITTASAKPAVTASTASAPVFLPDSSSIAKTSLVQGEWIDEDLPANNQPRFNLGMAQVADLDSLTEQEDRRSADIKTQQEDTKKQFHSSRSNVVESSTTAAASAWGKVDKEAVRVAKEEEQKRRDAARPVHLGQDFIPSAAHVGGSKPGYDFKMGPQGLGYYWNPQPSDEPPKRVNAWAARPPPPAAAAAAAAPSAAETAPASGSGYLRSRAADQTEPVAAAKPGVWKPSFQANRESVPFSGPPRISTSAMPSRPAVGEDGRDSLGLKRSATAWKPKSRE